MPTYGTLKLSQLLQDCFKLKGKEQETALALLGELLDTMDRKVVRLGNLERRRNPTANLT